MRVLVTGHTGFIGRNLVEFLKDAGVEIITYSRSQGKDILNDSEVFRATQEVDLVYHLAAYANPGESFTKPLEALQVNIMGTLNVLEACRKNNFSLIYISTCEIYGDSEVPIVEDSPLNPPNPYAASKAAADRLCYCYWRAYGLDIKILRLFNPYGPYQQINKVIPTFYFQATRNLPLTVFGDGSDTRDYTFIEDVVQALWMSRKLPRGQVVNICTGVATTTLELAHKMIELTRSRSVIKFTEYPKSFGGIRRQVGCPQKAKEMLGWQAKYTLDQGLAKTIQWLQERFGSDRGPSQT